MSLSSVSATTTTDDQGGATPITSIHTDIIQYHILNRLDGPTLASTCCATAQFSSLCSGNNLWRNICNSTWPSTADPRVSAAISAFPSGHRSFYSDSFPSLRHHHDVIPHRPENKANHPRVSNTSEFISAVDIYYDDVLLHSKVIVTETLSCWFLTSPFQVDLLGHKETVATPLKFEFEGACMSRVEERLRVSWILIDPVRKRAVNFASLKPVDVRRQWMEEDIQLRYATVVAAGGGDLVQCGVVVTLGGKEGGELKIKEASMQIEDMEGRIVIGIDSLVILNDAMEGQRRKRDENFEKAVYEKFSGIRVELKERKIMKERRLDVVFIGIGVSIFFALWAFFV
ncbi:hypothetical protein ACJIZ3_017396 [Penstemon smallii]|uniref:F-box protein n=1 Tax=Penstemon smallii TaxID=265156 RepID=A0ABD3SVF9_9LAMI